jgi:hypothetical protein
MPIPSEGIRNQPLGRKTNESQNLPYLPTRRRVPSKPARRFGYLPAFRNKFGDRAREADEVEIELKLRLRNRNRFRTIESGG